MTRTPALSTYPAATSLSDLSELERLSTKFYLLKTIIGGLLPKDIGERLPAMKKVLALRCGPGLWALEVARANPHLHVVGLDERPAMIEHACKQLRQFPSNLEYGCPPTLLRLPYPTGSFDLISAPFLSNYLDQTTWPRLLRECRRLLRPGGVLHLIEYDLGVSNAPAHSRFLKSFAQAMAVSKRSFSTSGEDLGYGQALPLLLQSLGFRVRPTICQHINYSRGAPFHQEYVRDLLLVARHMQALIVQTEIESPEQAAHLQRQLQREIHLPGFRASLPLLTFTGLKEGVGGGSQPGLRSSHRERTIQAPEEALCTPFFP